MDRTACETNTVLLRELQCCVLYTHHLPDRNNAQFILCTFVFRNQDPYPQKIRNGQHQKRKARGIVTCTVACTCTLLRNLRALHVHYCSEICVRCMYTIAQKSACVACTLLLRILHALHVHYCSEICVRCMYTTS